MTRRYFIRNSGLSLFGLGFVPTFVRRTAYALEQANLRFRKNILVAILQRGAGDGLNILVPFGEKEYYSFRPTISIPRPSSAVPEHAQTLIDLNGFFGFHPSLASLKVNL